MRLKILPEAMEEIVQASVWYGMRAPGLDQRFEMAVDRTIEKLLRYPESARVLAYDYRTAKVRGFPYRIIYRAKEGALEVRAVWQGEQNPARLRDRLAPSDDE